MTINDPPFDGKPCPMCPHQIRHLAAVAHNLITAADSRPYKLAERIEELRAALALVQPLSDAHFADRLHSHGQVERCTSCGLYTNDSIHISRCSAGSEVKP